MSPGWERVGVQIDSGAIDTVGPKEIANAFEMKETEMSKRVVGHVAANGSSVEKYGEKRSWVTPMTERVPACEPSADVKKLSSSAHKMNFAGNVVGLDGRRSYMYH